MIMSLSDLLIWRNYALRAMVLHAKALGVNKGVAFVSVQHLNGQTLTIECAVVNNTFQRECHGWDDKGSNYFGIALEKLAVMVSTDLNSGFVPPEKLKNGESPYRGGLVRKVGGYFVYTGFSGGTQDEDVEIATAGMDLLTVGY